MEPRRKLLRDILAFAKERGWSDTELAVEIGVSQQTLSNWKAREQVSKDGIEPIATRLGIVLGLPAPTGSIQIRHAEDPNSPEFVDIKESKISFAAGPGNRPSFELVEESEPASYRKSWMQKERLNPSKCIRYRIVNDSHEPFLFAGDVILVNLEETEIKDGKTYAMRYGDELRVKRLRKRVGGGLVLESWNERLYPPEVLTPEMVEEYIGIIGRVRDKSGRGGL